MIDTLTARNIHKKFGRSHILKDINLNIKKGEIVGLIGPNGAGKTTLLKSILGLAPCDGSIDVLGLNPYSDRTALMQKVSFVADTAILPSWIKVKQAIEFMQKVHPNFNREKALGFLANTNISLDKKVSQLSKGMITKTHLSLIMAIDAELLVLDEPTLGLDIIKRKEFYQQLLGEYFDANKTIIITTHQVEEVENILTRAVFIDDGNLILDENVENILETYSEITVNKTHHEEAQKHRPIHKRDSITGSTYMYKNVPAEDLAHLGTATPPSLADLFVASVAAH